MHMYEVSCSVNVSSILKKCCTAQRSTQIVHMCIVLIIHCTVLLGILVSYASILDELREHCHFH